MHYEVFLIKLMKRVVHFFFVLTFTVCFHRHRREKNLAAGIVSVFAYVQVFKQSKNRKEINVTDVQALSQYFRVVN